MRVSAETAWPAEVRCLLRKLPPFLRVRPRSRRAGSPEPRPLRPLETAQPRKTCICLGPSTICRASAQLAVPDFGASARAGSAGGGEEGAIALDVVREAVADVLEARLPAELRAVGLDREAAAIRQLHLVRLREH